MLAEGALEGLDYVIGQHVHSDVPVGQVRVSPGYIMASADSFEATLTGRGAHGAYPHQSVDPIFLLGQVIAAVQGIVARRVKPQEPAVVTIGAPRAGDAGRHVARLQPRRARPALARVGARHERGPGAGRRLYAADRGRLPRHPQRRRGRAATPPPTTTPW